MHSLLDGLREELKEAKRRGVITDFALRPGGRATLHWPSGTKTYTTNTLDTLATLVDHGWRA